MSFFYSSRQQYSPLKSNSQDSPLDSPLEVIDINLMHELKDVIFPTQKAVVSNVSIKCFRVLLILKTILKHKCNSFCNFFTNCHGCFS